MNPTDGGGVPAALLELAGLDRPALARRWIDSFGCPPPRNCQARLLRSALAWQYQMTSLGHGGSGATRAVGRQLKRATRSGPDVLSAGTRLVREWQGTTHHVTVRAKGFDYGGRTYRSLSALAREITGGAWSGPAFFGLRS